MFGHGLWAGFLTALILVVPVTVISAIGSKNVERTLGVGAILVVVYTAICAAVNWWGLPPVGFTKIAIYHEYWLIFLAIVVAAIATGFAAADYGSYDSAPSLGTGIAIVAIVVLGIFGVSRQFVWDQGRASSLANETHVVNEKTGTYPDSDSNHILQVPEQTADFKVKNVFGGANRELGTIYQVGTGTLQSVDNHLYWIYDLLPTGYHNSNTQYRGDVPAFAVVDAENPNVPAQLRFKDANGHAYRIKWYLGGYHGHKLERYIWGHGYSDQVVTGLTLEVNDSWVPYYTASVDMPISGLHREVPRTALVVNPQTGKITDYPIGNSLSKHAEVALPNWVDRVYTASVVKQMLNWWGEWGNPSKAPYKLTNEYPADRYQVDGEPWLVYTKGGHPVYQVIMTSFSSDTSAAYLVLFDARDNEAKAYSIGGLTLPSVVEHVIKGSGKNTKNPPLQPVHLTLHKIYGKLTWVAPLIRSTDDDASGASASQGIALLPFDETDGQSVVIATSMQEALSQYQEVLANGSSNAGPEENANTNAVEGIVSTKAEYSTKGDSVFRFMLKGDTLHVYSASPQATSNGDEKLELPFIKTGSHVRLTFIDAGSSVRNVRAYDDLGLQIGSGK